jgi:hypothetical protein
MRRTPFVTATAVAIAIAVALLGCGGAASQRPPRPEDMSAEAHRAEAGHERDLARDQMSHYDPTQTSADPPFIDNGLRPAPFLLFPMNRYNPTERRLAAADAHLRHAEQHERAAAALERFEDAQCGALPADTRAACPLLLEVVQIVNVPGGVRIVFTREVPLDAIVARMQCHLAYARTRGYDTADDCPLYVRGVRIERIPGLPAIDILARDPATIEQIRSRARKEAIPAP